MKRPVGSVAFDSMVRLCVIYAFAFIAVVTEGFLQNRYCSMNCELDDNLTFVHTVCDRGKEVGDNKERFRKSVVFFLRKKLRGFRNVDQLLGVEKIFG